jgi:hypothetical protein
LVIGGRGIWQFLSRLLARFYVRAIGQLLTPECDIVILDNSTPTQFDLAEKLEVIVRMRVIPVFPS